MHIENFKIKKLIMQIIYFLFIFKKEKKKEKLGDIFTKHIEWYSGC